MCVMFGVMIWGSCDFILYLKYYNNKVRFDDEPDTCWLFFNQKVFFIYLNGSSLLGVVV